MVDTKDDKVRKLFLPCGSSQGNERQARTFTETWRLCLHFSAAGWAARAPCPPRLPAMLLSNAGEAQSQGHPSPEAVQRGLAITTSPGEMCPRWGSRLHGCDDDDGWPMESIFHLQVVHVHIPTPGPGSGWAACHSVFLAVVTFSPLLTNGPISQPE